VSRAEEAVSFEPVRRAEKAVVFFEPVSRADFRAGSDWAVPS